MACDLGHVGAKGNSRDLGGLRSELERQVR